jgi:hypothetical protein
MKFRLAALGLHLLGSCVALTLILGGLYLGWYRWPGWYLADAVQVTTVLAGVDLVAGPLLTFIIASAVKPRRVLIRDIAVIVTVQLIALAYGTVSLWHGRPLYYAFSEDVLPPYAELVRFDAGSRLTDKDLRRAAYEMLDRQLAHSPQRNPWVAFGERLSKDLPELLAGTDSGYHAYAFANIRQCGAAFEVARSFVEWLADPPCAQSCAAAEALGRQVSGAKGGTWTKSVPSPLGSGRTATRSSGRRASRSKRTDGADDA